MLVILSPAKTQDFTSQAPFPFTNPPLFLSRTAQLVEKLKACNPQELESVLKVSPKLAALNFERYLQFNPHAYTTQNSKACIFAYQGDVYQGLQAETLSKDALDLANQHLLILSGLYGASRPLDGIQAYRLEMGIKLATRSKKDLYAFWHDTLQDYVNQRLVKEKVLINLASNEYSSVLNLSNLKGTVINVEFKDWSQGRFKVIGLFAKKARGLMARYLFENRLTAPEALQKFDVAGYSFQKELSSATHYIFHRRAS